jgi:hypothetical protein
VRCVVWMPGRLRLLRRAVLNRGVYVYGYFRLHTLAAIGVVVHAPPTCQGVDEQNAARLFGGFAPRRQAVAYFDARVVVGDGDLHRDRWCAVEDRVRGEFARDQRDLFSTTLDGQFLL